MGFSRLGTYARTARCRARRRARATVRYRGESGSSSGCQVAGRGGRQQSMGDTTGRIMQRARRIFAQFCSLLWENLHAPWLWLLAIHAVVALWLLAIHARVALCVHMAETCHVHVRLHDLISAQVCTASVCCACMCRPPATAAGSCSQAGEPHIKTKSLMQGGCLWGAHFYILMD